MSDVNQALLSELKKNGADFFTSVPCKLLGGFINVLEQDSDIDYLAVNREEEGLGLCMGAYLTGKQPVLVMQNTGVGTIITSLCSLALYYRLPLTMVISHRGSPGEPIGAQVPMGTTVERLLSTLNIPTHMFSDPAEVDKVGKLVEFSNVAEGPVAAILDFDFWGAR
ncbi:MAG: sulfopyruvate decarboxylase subunit alpha [Gammaproteobacteria bacterium]|nr:sulfopyruvate decarboxylase subunit alpha [Gammaproteobacteria bacterium]